MHCTAIKCFKIRNKSGVVCSRERCWVLPVSIGNHRLVHCEVFCIWRHVNRIRYLIRNNDFPKVVVLFGGQKIFFVFCVVGFYRSQSQHIAALASQVLAKVQHVRLLLWARRLLLRRLGLLVISGVHTSCGIERCCASC